MEEVQNNDVEQPVAQEIVNPETDSQQDQAASAQKLTSSQDRNWRELRKAKEEWEREAKFQREQNEWLRNQMSRPQTQVQPEEDILGEIAKEEYVPGEKVARGLKKIQEGFDKKLQAIENSYKQNQQNSLIQDLKREYPDFDDVVNPDNLELLENQNPRLAKAIAASNDPYLMAIQSYEYLKSKGLAGKEPKVTETERKIEQNKKTVQSPMAYEKRPMAQAFQMTDAMKKELFREMNQYAQQTGMGY